MNKPDSWRWRYPDAPWYYTAWMFVACYFYDSLYAIEQWFKVKKNRKIADEAPDAAHLRRLAGIKRDGEE